MNQIMHPKSNEEDQIKRWFDLSETDEDIAENPEDYNYQGRYVNRECNPYEFYIKLDIPFFDGHLHS